MRADMFECRIPVSLVVIRQSHPVVEVFKVAEKGHLMRTAPSREIASVADPSRAEQDYLKAIHRLGGAEHEVSPMKIANLLQVRAPSVTGMLRRFKERGWINYKPGSPVQLTPTGVIAARSVIRRNQLTSLFLARVLGLSESDVDAEAETLEHAVSPRLERALADYLNEPDEDLRGHPIPTTKGVLAFRPLSTFHPGQSVMIREADKKEPELSCRWQTLGLEPGATVQILTYQPRADLFQLQIGHAIFALTGEELDGLRGEVVETRNSSSRAQSNRRNPQTNRSH